MFITFSKYLETFIDHIPAISGFIIGCCAIFGNTWDKSKTGWRRLTRTGFLTLSALIIGAIFSVVTTVYSNNKKEKVDAHRSEVSKMIQDDIRISINELLNPFILIYNDTHAENYKPGDVVTIDMLLEEDSLKKSQEVCLDMRPTNFTLIPDQGTWREIFKDSITKGASRLEQLRLMQNQNLSSELMGNIRELLVRGPLIGYARNQSSNIVKKDRMIPDCFVGHAIGAHKEFLEMIKKISDASKNNVLYPFQ
ncbi:hypothetical protein PY32053_04731 (plasmid) [Paracoccus yeei]|jgi:hypothetical protein|uniref:Uncharacterized protein n=1 Tax=Paracoccus yeei TaxID=147645 RepID=A0A386UU62_9RHOB|nr:hypothetical protein [Paracoccus yeei]AYF04217.1 hypothetical protein PY32053_04731 [Paracoccus yeei]